MKVLRTVGAVGASILLASTATPAYANNFFAATTGARANWTDAGNVLKATDTVSDGNYAVAQIRRPSGSLGRVTARGGVGTSESSTYPGIPIDAPIEIRACRQDGDGPLFACSAWVDGYA